jgi:hypothetical protein
MMSCVIAAPVLVLAMCVAANAAETLELGGDGYLSGFRSELPHPVQRDVFVSGFSVEIDHKVERDVHAAGADIDVQAAINRDIEAAGLAVQIGAPVARNLSVIGASIKITHKPTIGGNARMAAKELALEAPVGGSGVAAAQILRIPAPVSGDLWLAPEPIDIPLSVVSADGIHFEPLQIRSPRVNTDWMHSWSAIPTILVISLVVIICLVLIAGLLLSLALKSNQCLQREVTKTPFPTMGIGILGLAMVLGLLPLCVITLIGLPFIPSVLLAVMALWIGGYLLGVIGLSLRTYVAFRPLPAGLATKLLFIAVGLIIVALLNFVPLVGWLLNLAVMFLGLGGILSRAGRAALSRQFAFGKGDEPEALPSKTENVKTQSMHQPDGRRPPWPSFNSGGTSNASHQAHPSISDGVSYCF